MSEPTTMFDHVGGMDFFVTLVDHFYEGVEADASMRPMYPEDLEPGKEALAYFLAQYWGGPTTYSDAKGHPRLRMRHVSFRITQTERDAWLQHMTVAVNRATVDGAPLDLAARTQMVDYFTMAANHLINAE
jgi:hemoglobin